MKYENVKIYKNPKELENRKSVMFKEFWVDPVKPMKTRLVADRFFGYKEHPKEFTDKTPAGFMFAMFGVIFQKQGSIKESQIKEVIWGFKQSGIPSNIIIDGLRELKQHGYLQFTDEKGNILFGDPTPDMWYKFSPKYLNLLLDTPKTPPEMERPEVDDTKI